MDVKKMNKSSAAVTSIGAAGAVIFIYILAQVGVEMSQVEASALTGAIAFIINFFIPSKG